MNLRLPRRHPVRVQRQPIVMVDCISNMNENFVELFVRTLRSIDANSRVLVQLKHGRIDDTDGLKAMAAALDDRLIAGGQAAFVAATAHIRQTLKRLGIAENLIVGNSDERAERTIILAERRQIVPAAGH